MYEEDYIELETAILAKELGYKNGSRTHYCLFHKEYIYDGDKNHHESYLKNEYRVYEDFHVNNHDGIDLSNNVYTAYERPTQGKLAKWLRCEFGIHIEMQLSQDGNWWFYLHIDIINGGGIIMYSPGADVPKGSSYEEVYELGLKEGLKNIK